MNAAGSPVDPTTGRLWADREQRLPAPTDGRARRPGRRVRASAQPSLATTIGVLLTDATLTKAQASQGWPRSATTGWPGPSAPLHSMMDGDTVFCPGVRPPTRARPTRARRWSTFNRLLAAAADAFTDACLDALLAAEGRGPWRGYRELAPSAVAGLRYLGPARRAFLHCEAAIGSTTRRGRMKALLLENIHPEGCGCSPSEASTSSRSRARSTRTS